MRANVRRPTLRRFGIRTRHDVRINNETRIERNGRSRIARFAKCATDATRHRGVFNRPIAILSVPFAEYHASAAITLAVSRLRHLVRRRPISSLIKIGQPLADKAPVPMA
jgi:hypothetical protein